MTPNEIFVEKLMLESNPIPAGKKCIVIFDIDDTLLTARGINVIKIMPDKSEIPLTPAQFAKEDVKTEAANGVQYSYREFRDPEKVASSIISATPILMNLKLMDSHLKDGWELGFLTARGLEDTVHDSIKKWLMYRDTDGQLKAIGDKVQRALFHAINDEVKYGKVFSGMKDFDKKAAIIRKYASEYYKVKFVDDDLKNVNAVREMAKAEGLKNITVVRAWGKE